MPGISKRSKSWLTPRVKIKLSHRQVRHAISSIWTANVYYKRSASIDIATLSKLGLLSIWLTVHPNGRADRATVYRFDDLEQHWSTRNPSRFRWPDSVTLA
jgi:hypothetical protein